jgi:DNA-binding CsgD family transcriptional regulator/PAS domain-containing protein
MSMAGLRGECPSAAQTLVRIIHAAGVSSTEWPSVLEQLRIFLDARFATLGYHEFATGFDSAMLESPDDADFGKGMAAYSARNPWFLSSDDYTPGRVMSGDEIISDSDLRRSDFYRGFLRPRGLLHRLCGVVAKRGYGAHLLSAYRAEDQAAFGSHEKAELEFLLDHITLSLQSQWRWQEADDLARALLAQSDHDTNPMILVTADAEPIYRNPAAEQLLDLGTGLRLDGSRLVTSDRLDQRLLRETIARVAQSDPSHAMASSVVTLACTPPTVVVVRAAGQVFRRQAGVRCGLVILTVRNGLSRHNPASCGFARQYELTVAQAKVSALVLAGQPLSRIARSLNVSENTVRSHLKQIFQKTETHGQMELVHLHARVCPAPP